MLATFWKDSALAQPWCVVLAASLIAAVIDLRTRRIPNWLTGIVFIFGFVFVVVKNGWGGLGDGLAGSLIVGGPYVILFLLTPTAGAGDAKLMGALGMWLGIHNGVLVLVLVTAVGAVAGVGYAMVKRRVGSVMANTWLIAFAMMNTLAGRETWSEASRVIPDEQGMLPVPYGLSIFIGVCLAAISVLGRQKGIWI